MDRSVSENSFLLAESFSDHSHRQHVFCAVTKSGKICDNCSNRSTAFRCVSCLHSNLVLQHHHCDLPAFCESKLRGQSFSCDVLNGRFFVQVYGGCRGNHNRFQDRDECLSVCRPAVLGGSETMGNPGRPGFLSAADSTNPAAAVPTLRNFSGRMSS